VPDRAFRAREYDRFRYDIPSPSMTVILFLRIRALDARFQFVCDVLLLDTAEFAVSGAKKRRRFS